jgi:hypothetical protein
MSNDYKNQNNQCFSYDKEEDEDIRKIRELFYQNKQDTYKNYINTSNNGGGNV